MNCVGYVLNLGVLVLLLYKMWCTVSLVSAVREFMHHSHKLVLLTDF